jgi:GT2 family glycosyltransferase
VRSLRYTTNDLPFVSIIIPTYSRQQQVLECLEVVSRSDYPPNRFEVIVVDDGSKPPLGDLEALFRGRITVTVLRQRRTGPAAARNAGAALAQGEFLAFTDDDCLPETGWLRALATRLAAEGNCVVGGRTINGLPDNAFAAASQEVIDVVYSYFNRDAERSRFFASNNMAVSARSFRASGGFDPTLTTSEDREFCDRWLHRGGTMVFVPNAVVVHMHHLTFCSYWMQHFNYGRGAFRFYARRAARGSRGFGQDLAFYKRLLLSPFQGGSAWRTVRRVFHLGLSQTASTVGLLWERLSPAPRKWEAD